MSVILDQYELFYAAVPKVACTSLKSMFFELENGHPFAPYKVNGRMKNVHNIGYRSMLRDTYPEGRIANFHRVTLVRDPVKRFLSAYSNRVLHHRELSREKAGKKLRELNLEPNPDLDLFVEKHADYLEAHPSILHHTRPMVDFLGKDAGYFSKIYPMEDMDQFARDISDRVGKEVTVGREQTGGRKFQLSDLSEAQTRKIRDYYETDYRVFSDYL